MGLDENLQIVSDFIQHPNKCLVGLLVTNTLIEVASKDLALIIAHMGSLVEMNLKVMLINFWTAVGNQFCYKVTSKFKNAVLAFLFSFIAFVIPAVHSKREVCSCAIFINAIA